MLIGEAEGSRLMLIMQDEVRWEWRYFGMEHRELFGREVHIMSLLKIIT